MYKVNLKSIKVPKKVYEVVVKEKNHGKKENEMISEKDIIMEEELSDSIAYAISQYTSAKYLNKETRELAVPWQERKMIGRIQEKIFNSTDGKMELSDDQLDFLVTVFQSNLPAFSFFFYLGEYFESLKLEGSKKE